MSDSLAEILEARLAAPGLTPMMRQYLTIKAEYSYAIVLFRMGDFFETFYEDAEDCARRLDITLTSRSKEKVPMAGVPHHAIDSYLSRLIEQGCTVVMVDQVEDPKQAKGLVRREITRVVTPGTYLDPHAPARKANYLAAIHLPKKGKRAKGPRWGLSALDLATGIFRATAGQEQDQLLDELDRLECREVVVLDSLAQDPQILSFAENIPGLTISSLHAQDHDESACLAALKKLLGAEEVKALGQTLAKPALVAAGMALAYAEQTQLKKTAQDLKGEASLAHIAQLVPYVPGSALVLDAQARAHLELFATQGDGGKQGALIGAIDEAQTAMGGRLLARWLAYPLRSQAEIEKRQRAVAALIKHPAQLDTLREGFKRVTDLERLLGRIALGRANPRDLAQLRLSLSGAPELLQLAKEVSTSHQDSLQLDQEQPQPDARLCELSQRDICADVFTLIEDAIVEEPVTDPSKMGVFKEGFDEELDRLSSLSTQGKNLIAELEAQEKEKTGISSLKVKYNKVFGYFIEVTKANLNLVPDSYVRKQTTVNSERFITEELKTLEHEVLNGEVLRCERAVLLFEKLINDISAHALRLNALGEALAELDVLCGLAFLAEQRDWVQPELHPGKEIEILDGRHPVIEQLSNQLGERFVPNDLCVGEEQRLVIITGPNMAGKSTIMRQTALIAILAHMGSFVPARKAKVSLLDRIFTRVGASDDLSKGRSTFMVEMNETARILRSATEQSLVLLDEIGRGTSTFDGLSIAWAVAEYLHDQLKAKTLFATHYHELTEICRDKEAAVNRHVAVREYNDEIIFLRKLEAGATNRSYGVQVGRLAGLPAAVVDRARQVLDSLEAQALKAGDTSAVGFLVNRRTPRGSSSDEQLHLFAAPAKEPEKSVEKVQEIVPRHLEKLLRELKAISLDDMTPRQAFAWIEKQQDLLRAKNDR